MSDERLHQDELVSAYLDGEATPAEIAEVEASDALLARVEELRAVRDAVAEPVTPLPGPAATISSARPSAWPTPRPRPAWKPGRAPAPPPANLLLAGGAVARAARERSEQERARRRPQRLLLIAAAVRARPSSGLA